MMCISARRFDVDMKHSLEWRIVSSRACFRQIAKLKKKREAVNNSQQKRTAKADKDIKKSEANMKKAQDNFKKALAEHVWSGGFSFFCQAVVRGVCCADD
jgi:hypothetical protein